MSSLPSAKHSHPDRLRAIQTMLRLETSQGCPATIREIQKWLADHDYPHNYDPVYDDLRALIKSGFVRESSIRRGHAHTYYSCRTEEDVFDIGTLKLLMDAIEACSLPDAAKTGEIQNKIAYLAGKEKGEALLANQIYFNAQRHGNAFVTETIVAIELALERRKKVSFVYYKWTVDGKEVPQREGYRYVVDPICVLGHDGMLYLWCFTPTHPGKPLTYRLDRMRDTAISEEDQTEEARAKKEEAEDYYRRTFSMYDGEPETVTLKFAPDLAGAMVDHFGERTWIARAEDGSGLLTEEVGISPTFFGWIDQFCGRVKITAPETVKKQYTAHLHTLLEANEEA